jgi:hypothetical protein
MTAIHPQVVPGVRRSVGWNGFDAASVKASHTVGDRGINGVWPGFAGQTQHLACRRAYDEPRRFDRCSGIKVVRAYPSMRFGKWLR